MYDIEHLKTQFKSDIIKSFQEDNDKSLKDIIKEKVNQFYVILNKEKYLKKTDQIYITISDQKLLIIKKGIIIFVYKQQSPQRQNSRNHILSVGKETYFIHSQYPLEYILSQMFKWQKKDYIISNPGYTQDQLYFNTLLSFVVAIIQYISIKISLQSWKNIMKFLSRLSTFKITSPYIIKKLGKCISKMYELLMFLLCYIIPLIDLYFIFNRYYIRKVLESLRIK
ncbi:unnamed protein product [Paramecium sonneborni]|uniref:Uncharacterized protein n=1 Tax=Paramecium sonneborni TaxID=65129 RepID=A0A8S1RT49_9CILI|nr:unnamed protein product [Paramecium sonneborni]